MQKGIAPILIVVFIALVLGGFLFYQKQTKTVSPIQQTTQPSPTTGADEIATWKTYTSSKYGYSITHPASWILKEELAKSPELSKVKISLNKEGGAPGVTIIVGKQNSLIKNGSNKIILGNVPAVSNTIGNAGGAFNQTISTSKNDYDYVIELEYTSHEVEWELDLVQQILSTFKFLDQLTVPPTKILTSDNSVRLKDVKYTLPEDWKATINDKLLINPPQGGGFLSIKSYEYPSNIDSKKYYCQLSKVCIEGTTYYKEVKLGNISGYQAIALDNSGGGPDYFGFKGNRFYIISTFTPPSPNEFETHFKEVLNSLVF